MTIRGRLLLLTTSMVTLVASLLIAVNLDSLAVASLDSALSISAMASKQIQSVIIRRLETVPPGPDIREAWNRQISTDEDLSALLEKTMAQSGSIVEINVASQEGIILASSNPARVGKGLLRGDELQRLRRASPHIRMFALVTGSGDYETRLPLGIAGQSRAVLTIQTLVSTVLFRDAAKAGVERLAILLAIVLTLAFGFAWWSANLALRPLARIGHIIDDIASGRAPQAQGDATRELAIVESKLSVLGERFRGAQQDLESALNQLDAGSRRQVEDQLTLARRLTAIGSLTGRVAHEIKNPLNSIALRLELLRSQIADEAPDAEPEIAVLSEEVTRLDRVVRTFLDFNRPLELSFEDLDLHALVAELCRFLSPEATQREITCEIDSENSPIIIRGDSGLLRQALLNIATNAIEAMERGGVLTFALRRTETHCDLRIRDTGPGIPKENLERIFQLYFTTKVRGSGIGLAMTFRAIQLHGGVIEVFSEPGHGTEFRLQLPLSEARGTI